VTALAGGLLLWLCAFPAGNVPGLAEAEAHYRAGRYEAALAEFRAAAESSPDPDGRVLYDVGNCAFRLGRYADAVLWYRRALLRLPRDPEVRFNLKLAEQRLGIEPEEETFVRSVQNALRSFTPAELVWLGAALETVALGLLLFGRRRKSLRNLGLALLVPALAACGKAAASLWLDAPAPGVVVAPEVAVRSEPRADLPVVLTLKAGEDVEIEGATDRWLRIRHGDVRGWAERAGIGVVD
jgi:tetratricopeptide (TPR) repeat protein